MGVKNLSISFSIKKKDLVDLLLLNKAVKITGNNGRSFVLSDISSHRKNGVAGKEDGCSHIITAIVFFDNRHFEAKDAVLCSNDEGKTYQGALSINFDRN
jgi:hypothetical protein